MKNLTLHSGALIFVALAIFAGFSDVLHLMTSELRLNTVQHLLPNASEALPQGNALSSTSTIITLLGLGLIFLVMALIPQNYSLTERIILPIITAISIEAAALIGIIYYNLQINTSLWQIALAGYLAAIILGELNIPKYFSAKTTNSKDNSENIFEQIFNDSFTGTIITSKNGIILAASKTVSSILKAPKDVQNIDQLYFCQEFAFR